MFERIKHFFDTHIAMQENMATEEAANNLRVAGAALFMEMLHMEEAEQLKKTRLVEGLLEQTFGIEEEQALQLMAIGEAKRAQATDYFEFTHLIGAEFSSQQKRELIESLWKVAFVDNHLDVEEEYLIDKIARLIFVPHAEVLEIRNRVRGL